MALDTKTRGAEDPLKGVVQFLTRTLWTLVMLVVGLLLIGVGFFLSDPLLAAITGAYGALTALIAIGIYAVFAVLRYTAM